MFIEKANSWFSRGSTGGCVHRMRSVLSVGGILGALGGGVLVIGEVCFLIHCLACWIKRA